MYTCLTNKNCSIEWPWYFETVFMNQRLQARKILFYIFYNVHIQQIFISMNAHSILKVAQGEKWNSIQAAYCFLFYQRHTFCVCYMVLSTHIQTWSSFSCRPVILSCVNVMWLMKRIHNNTYGKWRIHYSKKRVK